MPQLARITSTFFTTLINRLGIRPAFGDGFEMSNVVTPVSLVDSDITLTSISTTVKCDTPFTAGKTTAPAANTRLADTGAQAAGTYGVRLLLSAEEQMTYVLKRRNAADAADVTTMFFTLPVGLLEMNFTQVLLASERIVLENTAVATAGKNYQCQIYLALVS